MQPFLLVGQVLNFECQSELHLVFRTKRSILYLDAIQGTFVKQFIENLRSENLKIMEYEEYKLVQ